MTIDPFVAGILATIFVELFIINLLAITSVLRGYHNARKERKNGTDKEEL